MKAFGPWCWRNFSSTRHQLLRSVSSIFKFTNYYIFLWSSLYSSLPSCVQMEIWPFQIGWYVPIFLVACWLDCHVQCLGLFWAKVAPRMKLCELFAVYFHLKWEPKFIDQTSRRTMITSYLLLTLVQCICMLEHHDINISASCCLPCFLTGVFRRTCSTVWTVTDTATYSLFGGMLARNIRCPIPSSSSKTDPAWGCCLKHYALQSRMISLCTYCCLFRLIDGTKLEAATDAAGKVRQNIERC